MSISILFTFLILATGLLMPRPARAHDPGKERPVLSNKVIPELIRCEAEIALSHYPALADARIEFRFKSTIKNSMMQAQPRGLFRGKGRYYVINISEAFFLDKHADAINGIPSEALIGWLVHELGHIMDYHQRSSMGMVVFGFKYVTSGKYLREAERAADTYAVDHGCGNYLVHCKEFILGHEELPETYKDKIRRSYLCPQTIRSMMDEREMIVEIEEVGEAEEVEEVEKL